VGVVDSLPPAWTARLEYDRRHIWHPYAAAENPAPVWPVVAAQGVELVLADGRRLIDGMASWWAAIHGYNHPRLNAALHAQVDRFAHVMFGGLTHEPAVALARRLVEITPAGLQRVFFADSGSVSVEVALKMAIQCWEGRGHPEKKRILTVRYGYHGDTLGAMSVCDPDGGMHRLFKGAMPQQIFAPAPAMCGAECGDDDIDAFADLLRAHCAHTAAVILEPIVQGAGGMRFYRPQYLTAVAALCREHNVLLILDEIATGFGRTGSLFACEQANVEPDILCLGKALTGGTMTLAATLVSDPVAVDIDRSGAGVLMHGPTFMANPMACSVALASIDLLLESDWSGRVAELQASMRAGLAPCRDLVGVRDVRVLGAIGVVELDHPSRLDGVQAALVERGVWLRPFRNLLYMMPPYIMTREQTCRVTDAVVQVLAAQRGVQ